MAERYVNPASTVDLIVPRDGGIVFVRRKNEPFKDYLALPGGFLEYGKETLEEAACRELFEETGLLAKPEDLRLVGVYSDPKRDPRDHVIAHAYEVLRYSGVPKASDDAAEVGIYSGIPPNLAFDHEKILRDYFKSKQNGVRK